MNRFDDLFVDPIYLKFKKYLWNYQVRFERVREILKKIPYGRTLEVGAGVAPLVEASSYVTYTDLSEAAILHLKSYYSQCECVVSAAGQLPFSSQRFFKVVSSEVLEHVRDDDEALREMHRILEIGGYLVLTVPCHSYFYSIDDEFVQHQRRYDPKELRRRLQGLGFMEIKIAIVTGVLDKAAYLIAVTIFKLFSAKSSDKSLFRDDKIKPLLSLFFPVYRFLNIVYAFLVRLEAQIIPMSWATSILVVARKDVKHV